MKDILLITKIDKFGTNASVGIEIANLDLSEIFVNESNIRFEIFELII